MRQYRGKTKDGKWVYGCLIETGKRAFIVPAEWLSNRSRCAFNANEGDLDWHEVIPSTVGQQVGLQDKHGVDVYEGDIIVHHTEGGCRSTYVVEFRDGAFVQKILGITDEGRPADSYEEIYWEWHYMEVVRTIHDTPEKEQNDGE